MLMPETGSHAGRTAFSTAWFPPVFNTIPSGFFFYSCASPNCSPLRALSRRATT
jgi:hypothetical protein